MGRPPGRDRKDEFDLAHVGRETDAVTHRAEDRIAGALAQASCCAHFCERLENTIAPQGSIGGAVVLHLPRGRPLERRAAGSRVRGRDRGVPRRRQGPAPCVPAANAGAADPRALRRGVLPPANPVREHRRTKAAPTPVDRGWECRDQGTGPALSRGWKTVPPARGASQIDPVADPPCATSISSARCEGFQTRGAGETQPETVREDAREQSAPPTIAGNTDRPTHWHCIVSLLLSVTVAACNKSCCHIPIIRIVEECRAANAHGIRTKGRNF